MTSAQRLARIRRDLHSMRDVLTPQDWINRNLVNILLETIDYLEVVDIPQENQDDGSCKGKQGSQNDCSNEPICCRPD